MLWCWCTPMVCTSTLSQGSWAWATHHVSLLLVSSHSHLLCYTSWLCKVACPGLVWRNAMLPYEWSSLHISVRLPDSIPNPHLHQYLTCSSVTGYNGEHVNVYSWVLTQKTCSPESPIHVIRVVEILQVYGTSQQLNGCANLILVLFHDVSQLAPTYMLPSLVPREWGLISAKVSCHPSTCAIFSTVSLRISSVLWMCNTIVPCTSVILLQQIPVWQENKLMTTTQWAVYHKGGLDYILNVGQLYDACHMTSFWVAPPSIDEDTAILTGTTHEIDLCKRDDTLTMVSLGHGALWGRAHASRSNGTATGLSSDIMRGSSQGRARASTQGGACGGAHWNKLAWQPYAQLTSELSS